MSKIMFHSNFIIFWVWINTMFCSNCIIFWVWIAQKNNTKTIYSLPYPCDLKFCHRHWNRHEWVKMGVMKQSLKDIQSNTQPQSSQLTEPLWIDPVVKSEISLWELHIIFFYRWTFLQNSHHLQTVSKKEKPMLSGFVHAFDNQTTCKLDWIRLNSGTFWEMHSILLPFWHPWDLEVSWWSSKVVWTGRAQLTLKTQTLKDYASKTRSMDKKNPPLKSLLMQGTFWLTLFVTSV